MVREGRENPLEDGKQEYRISRTAPLDKYGSAWAACPSGISKHIKARGGYRPLRLFSPSRPLMLKGRFPAS